MQAEFRPGRAVLRAFAVLVFLALFGAMPLAAAAERAAPAMRWDFHPEAPRWTAAALRALRTHGAPLSTIVPRDIARFCPGYRDNGPEDRRAFWAALFSALAKHESTWNPAASGGGGRWIGLLQIAPRTARYYGCRATSPAALKDGAANIGCAVRIATIQVARDGVVAGDGRQGVGRDWAPMRSARKSADIAAWTRAQSYCQPR